jgi:hypothetical protein
VPRNYVRKGGHGGKRKASGLKKGQTLPPVKIRRALAELARQYTERAVRRLAYIMDHGETHAVQVMASCALLDRGYGRPPSVLDVTARVQSEAVYNTPEELRKALLARGLPESLLPPALRDVKFIEGTVVEAR